MGDLWLRRRAACYTLAACLCTLAHGHLCDLGYQGSNERGDLVGSCQPVELVLHLQCCSDRQGVLGAALLSRSASTATVSGDQNRGDAVRTDNSTCLLWLVPSYYP